MAHLSDMALMLFFNGAVGHDFLLCRGQLSEVYICDHEGQDNNRGKVESFVTKASGGRRQNQAYWYERQSNVARSISDGLSLFVAAIGQTKVLKTWLSYIHRKDVHQGHVQLHVDTV